MNVTINDPSTIMAVNGRVTSNDLRIGTAIAIAMPTNAVKVRSSDWYASSNGHSLERRSHNGRFLRHRFSPKPTNVATPNSLPKRINVAKETVSAAWQTRTHHRNGRPGKPNDVPITKPRPCVKNMLHDRWLGVRFPFQQMAEAIPRNETDVKPCETQSPGNTIDVCEWANEEIR